MLYHMAQHGAWPEIERHGLLSTSALLDLHGVQGAAREAVEGARRPGLVAVGTAVVRDQGPMTDAGLHRCLTGGMVPADWYRLLNGMTFFWLSGKRLQRLLGAVPYRDQWHDVLELDTAALVAACRVGIRLSAIISGATRTFPVPRGPGTFLPIKDYPYAYWRQRRPRWDRVVELTVADGVPDVARFVRRVTAMRAGGPAPYALV